ncbi:MAG TPA: oligogalacturonate lyase family protein [Candidatus Brocadiia bacterium]|nr:oligogalacturonate lyase family protein [Candidatus Brocadiia bacterium]
MPKGSVSPAEGAAYRDPKTGVLIRQVTEAPCINHHPFFYIPAYDDAMTRLFFVSHRTGRPEIFAEILETARTVQLTERDEIAEWSVHPSHDGRYVYFIAGAGAWRACVETFKEEKLADFGDAEMREKGMIGAAMGTTTLSSDDRWWAVPVKEGGVHRFHLIDTSSGKSKVILERDTIGHPQFHPNDPGLLRYAGPYYDRIWVINRDGTGNRLLYRRNVAKKQWIVHETWLPGTREVVTADWPRGMIGINVDTGAVRPVTNFPAWHAVSDRSGCVIVCDTTFPDTGIHLFNASDGDGRPRLLCLSESSNVGQHWNIDHCPYDDGPVKVVSPQHTHPHPSFSPDGRRIVFTTDKTGHPQVCEVAIPPELLNTIIG